MLMKGIRQLSDKLAGLAGDPTSLTLDGLRLLERKTATVCTLLKASVYSIVLQQQMINESEEQQQQEQREYEEGQEGQEGQEERFQDDGDVSMTGRYA
jgi:DASH complex subunit DAD3